MSEKITKVLKYIKGAGILYGIYGFKYKLYSELDYSKRKYGKKKFAYKKIKGIVKKYQHYENNSKLSINNTNKKHLDKFPIWVCWFQGICQAPEIVKMCLNTIQKNISENSQVHIITFENLDSYVNIPKLIKEKVKRGNITLTQYSDIIRFALLSKYGGFWIDSTVLVTSKIDDLCNYEYYTKKSDRLELNFGNYLIQGRFTTHLNKGDNTNILYNFIYDAYIEYYKKMNISIDYFLTNIFADIAYEYIPKCRKMMDELPYNDKGMESRLCENLNQKYNEEEFQQYCKNMPFQKLSYKLKEYKEEKDGDITFYGYLMNKYRNEDMNNFTKE